MIKNKIKKLAQLSYTKGELDGKKVQKIANFLSRQDLKEYIKILRELENAKKVTVIVPRLYKDKEFEKKLSGVFDGKKIVFKEEPSLITGLRVENNDLIYELSLKNTLENLNSHING